MYVNNICGTENVAAWWCSMPVTADGHQDANLQWPNIQISSKYIKLYMYQMWHFYHKMNNRLAMLAMLITLNHT